jgi:DNA-binding SARP family transcriptional activator
MDSRGGQNRIRDGSPVAERQTAYSLNRLIAAVNELSRMVETQPSSMIERVLAGLDNAAEHASAGIEAVHELRLWRANHRWLAAELEWPNHSHTSARNNLNVALCSLRNTLDWSGPDVQAILHKEGCYLLNPALTWWTDRNEFRSMIHSARSARQLGDTQQTISACRSAVQLYRGPLFEDDLDGEWFLAERRHLKDLYLQALEHLAEIYCDSGELVIAIEFGQQAISSDPCYEAAHRLLMRCYARQHQQQLVSRQYRLCAAALQEELDVSPTTETVQLFRTLTSAT